MENTKPVAMAPIELPPMPEGSNVDMQQLAQIFASQAAVAEIERRVRICEGKND